MFAFVCFLLGTPKTGSWKERESQKFLSENYTIVCEKPQENEIPSVKPLVNCVKEANPTRNLAVHQK